MRVTVNVYVPAGQVSDFAVLNILAVVIWIELAGLLVSATDPVAFADIHVFIVGIGDVGPVAIIIPDVQIFEDHSEVNLRAFIVDGWHAVDSDGGRRLWRKGRCRCFGGRGRGSRCICFSGCRRFSGCGRGCRCRCFGGRGRCGRRGIDGDAAVAGKRNLLGGAVFGIGDRALDHIGAGRTAAVYTQRYGPSGAPVTVLRRVEGADCAKAWPSQLSASGPSTLPCSRSKR